MKNNTWAVYTHTSPSGKVYVGISKDLKNRWACSGAKYCSYESVFKYAIIKYGWDNLKHTVLLEGITKSEAIYAEKYLIRWYKIHGLSYNITDGGEGMAGIKRTEEEIQKTIATKVANNSEEYLVVNSDFDYKIFLTTTAVAEYLGGSAATVRTTLSAPIHYKYKGHYILRHVKSTPVDIETIKASIEEEQAKTSQKLSQLAISRKNELNAASRAAMAKMSSEEKKMKYGHGDSLRGKHRSEETKMKISAAAKGRDMSKAIEASKKRPHDYAHKSPVIQFDLEGRYINEFPSVKEATSSLGKRSNAISNCLRGRTKKAFGYIWKYKVEGGQ